MGADANEIENEDEDEHDWGVVPGYYRAVPPGQKPFARRSVAASRTKSALMG